MAITQDYVDYGTGNDYKGATFTDGAWTAATHTLAKTGAFAATKANHWLYLEPNGGVSFTAGYFKVATVPDANSVTLASDPAVGNLTDVKCTQADGTTTKPWRSLQGAFDLLTRNTTDGNQVNLKAGTAQVNAAALDLTVFVAGGGLASVAPLIVRGYTTAANDGGVGDIDCNSLTMWAATTYDHLYLADLHVHHFGDNDGIVLDAGCTLLNCEIENSDSSPSGKALVKGGYSGTAWGCYLHDPGEGAAKGIINFGTVEGCYIVMEASATNDIACSEIATVRGNIVRCASTSASGMVTSNNSTVVGNVFYSSAASTARGIYSSNNRMIAANNVIVGWSGTGGDAIQAATSMERIGYNAFYNNTATYTLADVTFLDLTANDVTLAADPFVDAANGDFSLTAAGKTALRGLGWPASYLGAHANTDGHVTIGAVQYGEAEASGGGGPVIGSRIIRGLGAV